MIVATFLFLIISPDAPCRESLLKACKAGDFDIDVVCQMLTEDLIETEDSLCSFINGIHALPEELVEKLICARLLNKRIEVTVPLPTSNLKTEKFYNIRCENLKIVIRFSLPMDFVKELELYNRKLNEAKSLTNSKRTKKDNLSDLPPPPEMALTTPDEIIEWLKYLTSEARNLSLAGKTQARKSPSLDEKKLIARISKAFDVVRAALNSDNGKISAGERKYFLNYSQRFYSYMLETANEGRGDRAKKHDLITQFESIVSRILSIINSGKPDTNTSLFHLVVSGFITEVESDRIYLGSTAVRAKSEKRQRIVPLDYSFSLDLSSYKLMSKGEVTNLPKEIKAIEEKIDELYDYYLKLGLEKTHRKKKK